MLIDMHAHTRGISRCCRIYAPEMLRAAKEAGLDGVVLTNHYQKDYVGEGGPNEFAAAYVAEYRQTAAKGAEMGILVFCGIELTMAQHRNVHVLIYGVGEDFVLRYPTVYDLTLEELKDLVDKEGGVLVQAHPLRYDKNDLLDNRYLTGVEISCHPLYDATYLDELSAVARQTGLILTCGGDYHADTRRPRCGMYLPDSIMDSTAIGAYLKAAAEVRLLVDEINDEPPFEVVYLRSTKADRA
ncbi:MAG: hypothetical protein E7639_06635 [Ruminococcaceae bacterium]|nr:hypothetical protein [Oscillospiraceae bacterium]